MARQIVLFHFRCPLCGAKAPEVSLEDISAIWAELSFADLKAMVDEVVLRLGEILGGNARWTTKAFQKAVSRVEAKHFDVFGSIVSRPELIAGEQNSTILHCTRDCPLCNSAAGPRRADSYFTTWNNACKIQTANLLYETDLVLWSSLRSMPEWANSALLVGLNNFRVHLRGVSLNMELMVCPQCGRPVSFLFGENAENYGYCRHCYDMAGGKRGVFIGLSVDKTDLSIQPDPTIDPSGPARASEVYMPPEAKKGTEF